MGALESVMDAIDAAGRVEAVYRSVHVALWRALLSFTGDAELASDAESEAFAQVLRRGGEVDDVAAWVWRSAFRIAAGLLSARPRSLPPLPPGTDVAPETGSVAEFLGLLAGLSAQQRACVVLRYVGGFTPGDIAELLDTSAGTVRVQLHRAHASLRQTLKEAGHA